MLLYVIKSARLDQMFDKENWMVECVFVLTVGMDLLNRFYMYSKLFRDLE